MVLKQCGTPTSPRHVARKILNVVNVCCAIVPCVTIHSRRHKMFNRVSTYLIRTAAEVPAAAAVR